jgi:hypothetical protein
MPDASSSPTHAGRHRPVVVVHQRLDVSLNDDRCRVRNTNGLWILGMLRRLAISLYMHWRDQQHNPHSLWFTDFQAALGENNLAKAFAFVTNRHPKLA